MTFFIFIKKIIFVLRKKPFVKKRNIKIAIKILDVFVIFKTTVYVCQ